LLCQLRVAFLRHARATRWVNLARHEWRNALRLLRTTALICSDIGANVRRTLAHNSSPITSLTGCPDFLKA
jgi:hypothetical protein